MRSASFYSRNSNFLTSSGDDIYKRRTREMVQHGINSGVVVPLKRLVFDPVDAGLAVS